jgi:hypothetical protein
MVSLDVFMQTGESALVYLPNNSALFITAETTLDVQHSRNRSLVTTPDRSK